MSPDPTEAMSLAKSQMKSSPYKTPSSRLRGAESGDEGTRAIKAPATPPRKRPMRIIRVEEKRIVIALHHSSLERPSPGVVH
jgi:hypothetical protein